MRNTPTREGGGVDCQLPGYNASHSTSKLSRQQKWAAANPQARWAHMALASAIKRGLIARQPCEECGAEPADGHHPDYDRPMAVVWLCRRHHRALHCNGGAK